MFNSTEGEEIEEFLADEELKDAVRGTVDSISIAAGAEEGSPEAEFWDITTKGLDELLNATTPEEAKDSEFVKNITSVNGDIAEVLIDIILESIDNSTDTKNEDGALFPTPAEEPTWAWDDWDTASDSDEPADEAEPEPVKIDEEELERINSIFEEGFKNMGTFRKSTRSSIDKVPKPKERQ